MYREVLLGKVGVGECMCTWPGHDLRRYGTGSRHRWQHQRRGVVVRVCEGRHPVRGVIL